MSLSDIWNAYSKGEYITSLRMAVQDLTDAAGIDLLHIAGLSLMNLRRTDEAVTLLNAAITFRPESPHVYANAAYLAERSGLRLEAEHFAEAGLKDFPDDPDLLLLKANSYVTQMRFEDAVPIYRQLLERDPKHVQSIINLGNIARAMDNFEEAVKRFDEAEAIDPDFRDLVFARATMYTQMGDDTAAIALLEPIADDVDAQFLLALLYLSRGDYVRGFRLYRSRANAVWYKTGNFVYPISPFDHWSEAAGKNIAVIQEGGFGDMIQFVRYMPMLSEVAGSVTLFTPPSLLRLFNRMSDYVTIKSSYEGYNPAEFDYVTTDVEMAYHFRTSIDTVPNAIPYLFVPDEVIAARRLPPTKLKRVGLCWAGGQRDDLNQRSYDYRRSFDLATYAPLGQIPGIEFVSLQLGQRDEQTCAALPMLCPLELSFDFMDTAAIIQQLDLVISVDTAVVHLAAAIGKPVWLLSRYDACWRWLRNRSNNPWYPGIRIFGQKVYRDWSHPIQELTAALAEWA